MTIFENKNNRGRVTLTIPVTEVLRRDVVVSTSNIYTPTAADRDGITIRCTDTEHSNWRVQDDIVKSQHVRPYCKF